MDDFLRFYKECLANESENYVQRRAHDEGKSPLQILSDIKREVIIASENIVNILTRFGSEAPVKAWQEWEYGYVCVRSLQCLYRILTSHDRLMHFELERYKLGGLLKLSNWVERCMSATVIQFGINNDVGRLSGGAFNYSFDKPRVLLILVVARSPETPLQH